MTEQRDFDLALDEIAQLARTAKVRFRPLRAKAEQGEISAAAFHQKLADTCDAILAKIDAVHRKRISKHVWIGKEAGEIRAAFQVARNLVNRSALDA